MDLEYTDERVIPELMNPRSGILLEHIARYEFAKRFVKGRVLDIACGVGYGADILLDGPQEEEIEEIVGLDISKESIEYAKYMYGFLKTKFYVQDITQDNLPVTYGIFDTIVCFETIEHLVDDYSFIKSLQKLLKPMGTLIISTPFGKGRGIPCSNPYHIHQYKEGEFLDLLSVFSKVDMYKQIDQIIEKPIENKKYYIMVAVCFN
ncbi:class I SAM-dependent methyltransferase [Serpentinicella alkaliphila]|uniref:Methyltransferase family protein n=1 Tax=Serpentinicella alkaliphila TaxID=1734049 RepID=A0A4R2TCM5_9FIRM|nr:methyltransferase domain-containing protein [Serpentinicella alkaliphila]TCP99686.1 methyltransferase family protein [Serpentinicella alkaliphila]